MTRDQFKALPRHQRAERFARFLRIERWARNRYQKNGQVIISMGGQPSRYSIIEELAGIYWLGLTPRWPHIIPGARS